MKICHIITGLEVGGAERALHTVLSSSLAEYHECSVISLLDMGHYGPLIDRLGIPVHCLGMSAILPGIGDILRLRSMLREIEPDIIQGWMYHGNLAATAGRFLVGGNPTVVWNIRHSLHRLRTQKWSTRAAIHLSRMLSKNPDAIVYNSSVSRHQHEALGFEARKGRIIPNGFDLSIWRPIPKARTLLREAIGLNNDDPLLGYVGRFDPLKDIPNLLTALQLVMRVNPRIHVALIGRGVGPDNLSLEPYLSALPADRLHILGQRSDMIDVYPAFDLLCLCSSSEAFPNVVGEAMAVGVPAVVTDVGDCAAMVGDTGWIVPPSDSEALARNILAAVSESDEARRQRGVRARQRIKANFSLAAAIEQYSQLYRETVNKR